MIIRKELSMRVTNSISKLASTINSVNSKSSFYEDLERVRRRRNTFDLDAYIDDMVYYFNNKASTEYVDAEYNQRTGKYSIVCTNPSVGSIKFTGKGVKSNVFMQAFKLGAIDVIKGFNTIVFEKMSLVDMPKFDAPNIEFIKSFDLSELPSLWIPRASQTRLVFRSGRLGGLDFLRKLDPYPELIITDTDFHSLSVEINDPSVLQQS